MNQIPPTKIKRHAKSKTIDEGAWQEEEVKKQRAYIVDWIQKSALNKG